MDDRELIQRSKDILEKTRQLPPEVRWQRMIDKGLIDENGNVPLWDAFLAVVAIKPSNDGNKILYFRCLKPALGMPGFAQIDIRRDSMLEYIAEDRRVITAYRDNKFNRWQEGAEVHATSKHYLRTDSNDVEEDDLGELPVFETVNSRF